MYIIDAEFDGLNPSKVHCLSVLGIKTGKVFTTTDPEVMKKFLTQQDVLIGHNISRFDIPVFERLFNIKIKAKLYDTLALSWYLYPNSPRHGLEYWGQVLGVLKPKIDNWFDLSIEEYVHRCEEDVKINFLLWKKMWEYLQALYGAKENTYRFLDYMHLKMRCAALQEKSGWLVDLEYAKAQHQQMLTEKENKLSALESAMPSVPVTTIKTKPKRYLNKDGGYSKLGQEWNLLLQKNNLPLDYEGEITVVTNYETGNPSSPVQVKDWLYSLGWVPETFKFVKESDGSMRQIPQINLEHGKGICDSIKKLYEKEPRLELLDGLSVLNHRIPTIKSIIDSVDKQGRTKAQVQGLTNTLRFKHATVVNLPKVDRAYGESIRGSLIAGKGKILCGSDMASLEDRIKQHFIYPLDRKYVESMNQEGFDPHLVIAVMAGMMTQEEADEYKAGNKRNKPIRDIAKNGNYACQYGAGPPRLVLTCGISLDQARRLHQAYWDLNWAIKAVAEKQVTKEIKGQMWLFNPVSRFWYSLRTPKDKFSTLVQGTASYVFDCWVEKIINIRPQLTGQFHDEIILEIVDGSQEKAEKLLRDCIAELNQELKLNRELGIDVQFGYRYSEIH